MQIAQPRCYFHSDPVEHAPAHSLRTQVPQPCPPVPSPATAHITAAYATDGGVLHEGESRPWRNEHKRLF